jgi:hypothetical protein
MQMKVVRWVLFLIASLALNASATDLAGSWKVLYAGPAENAPKTIGSIVLDLKLDGKVMTGTAHIGVWPGDAPIANGKVEGDHISFQATGHLGSSTGIPTCQFDATVHGDEMLLTMTVVANAGGPIGAGVNYQYKGKKKPE